MCSDDGRAMHSSPLRRQAHRFGRQRTQSAIEFPCYAPQQDGKSTKMTGNLANVGLHSCIDASRRPQTTTTTQDRPRRTLTPEVAVSRQMFVDIPSLILRPQAPLAPAQRTLRQVRRAATGGVCLGTRCKQSGVFQHCGAVNRRLRSPFARGKRNCHCPNLIEERS